jgi:hypothetical protein
MQKIYRKYPAKIDDETTHENGLMEVLDIIEFA